MGSSEPASKILWPRPAFAVGGARCFCTAPEPFASNRYGTSAYAPRHVAYREYPRCYFPHATCRALLIGRGSGSFGPPIFGGGQGQAGCRLSLLSGPRDRLVRPPRFAVSSPRGTGFGQDHLLAVPPGDRLPDCEGTQDTRCPARLYNSTFIVLCQWGLFIADV